MEQLKWYNGGPRRINIRCFEYTAGICSGYKDRHSLWMCDSEGSHMLIPSVEITGTLEKAKRVLLNALWKQLLEDHARILRHLDAITDVLTTML